MPRPALFAALLASCTLALLQPAAAVPREAPTAANLSSQQAMRSIGLLNRSGSGIERATVQTTDGRTWSLAPGGVPSRGGAHIIVPEGNCIADVSVTLANGRTLRAAGLHSCNRSEIVVRADKITIPQIAVPGAKQHGTPG